MPKTDKPDRPTPPQVPPSKNKHSDTQYQELIAMYNTLTAKYNVAIAALKLSDEEVTHLKGEVKSLQLLIQG